VILTAALLAAAIAAPARAQCNFSDHCITISRTTDMRILSADFGYGAAAIGGLGATPDRTMRGFNIGMDVHILSLALHNVLPFAVYDALSVDLTYGKMTSTPLLYLSQPEDNSTLPFTGSYSFLAGVRRQAIGVLAGFTIKKFNHDIGGTSMSGSSTPITARVELGSGPRQIVLTGMAGGMTGARIDVPFFRRLNLSAAYWQADATAVPWSTNSAVPAKAKMLLLGFRTAEKVR
jgi:hypothetical protein